MYFKKTKESEESFFILVIKVTAVDDQDHHSFPNFLTQ